MRRIIKSIDVNKNTVALKKNYIIYNMQQFFCMYIYIYIYIYTYKKFRQ